MHNYELAVQNSFADVENVLVIRKKLVEQIEAQERLVKANSEYTRLARLQYEGGYTPYSTVLQAEQMLLPSEINLVQSRTSASIALVNLYKALGGGWLIEAQQLTIKGGGTLKDLFPQNDKEVNH
ncbi:MAG: TolC family protein [Desulfomicrobium escambiense]|nr:TolC family protein [Desulfomicrobium escambiense]